MYAIYDFLKSDEKHLVQNAHEPVLVMFLTNGETIDQKATVEQLVKASHTPIFWQFMAMGITKKDLGTGFWAWLHKPFAEDYSFLEELDTMDNRFIDNANFFSIAKPLEAGDERLYELMMNEYPEWLKLAYQTGMLAMDSNT